MKNNDQYVMGKMENQLHNSKINARQSLFNAQPFKNLHLSYITKFLLFITLMQLLISAVIIVLLASLKYIGFDNSDSLQKVIFHKDECKINEWTDRAHYLMIKIKTAFIFMSVEFILGFVLLLLVYKWTSYIKINNFQRRIKSLYQQLYQEKIIFILASICTLLLIIVFGSYLFLIIWNNNNRIPTQCRIDIKISQITAITALAALNIVLLLLILIIFVGMNINMKKITCYYQDKNSNKMFPYIGSNLQSISLNTHRQQNNKNNQLQKRKSQEIFKPLKTQDFLLELKSNQEGKQNIYQHQVGINHNRIEQQQQNEQTYRRLVLYKPDVKQYVPKQNIRKSQQQLVNNSLQNGNQDLLMINSVQKRRTQIQMGILPFNSKKKQHRLQKKHEQENKQDSTNKKHIHFKNQDKKLQNKAVLQTNTENKQIQTINKQKQKQNIIKKKVKHQNKIPSTSKPNISSNQNKNLNLPKPQKMKQFTIQDNTQTNNNQDLLIQEQKLNHNMKLNRKYNHKINKNISNELQQKSRTIIQKLQDSK